MPFLLLPPLLGVVLTAAFVVRSVQRERKEATDVARVAISGEVEYVDMRNPHSVMRLKVAAEDGSAAVWDIEFSSVNLLLRRGWDFDRIKVGDRVTCVGNPSATGKAEMYMWSIKLSDGTEFGR